MARLGWRWWYSVSDFLASSPAGGWEDSGRDMATMDWYLPSNGEWTLLPGYEDITLHSTKGHIIQFVIMDDDDEEGDD